MYTVVRYTPDRTSGLIMSFGTCANRISKKEFSERQKPEKELRGRGGALPRAAARKCDASELSRIDKSWNASGGIDWGDAGGVVIRAHLRGRVAIPVCSTGDYGGRGVGERYVV